MLAVVCQRLASTGSTGIEPTLGRERDASATWEPRSKMVSEDNLNKNGSNIFEVRRGKMSKRGPECPRHLHKRALMPQCQPIIRLGRYVRASESRSIMCPCRSHHS